ncbi:MAG: ROK family protein [Alkalicoccus sp.]|nr:MAG: ROK family protein [Alkalicoccus sp.]
MIPEEEAVVVTKRIGIDIGGTSIKAALIGDGGIIKFREKKTPESGDQALEVIGSLTEGWLEKSTGSVGIAAPGPLDTSEGIFLDPPNLPGWHGFPLKEKMEGRLGRECLVENDANAAAVGEFTAGAGKSCQSLVYITISTGVGGGIIAGGRLLSGAYYNAGEIGNMIIADEGPYQAGMNRGSWESLASGTALGKAAELELGLTGGAEEFFNLVKKEDKTAEQVYRRWLDYTARGTANIIHTLNPEAIVFGGGVMKAADVFFEDLHREVKGKVYESLREKVDIRRGELGAMAGAAGAAALETMGRI